MVYPGLTAWGISDSSACGNVFGGDRAETVNSERLEYSCASYVYLVCVSVCVCAHTRAITHMWQSEGNFWNLTLSSEWVPEIEFR